jgi:DNA gyrase subunit A
MEGGKVVRSAVTGVPAKGRDTMGVIFAKPDKKDRIIGVARNSERSLAVDDEAVEEALILEVEPDGTVAGSSPEAANEVPLSTEETAELDAESPENGGSE